LVKGNQTGKNASFWILTCFYGMQFALGWLVIEKCLVPDVLGQAQILIGSKIKRLNYLPI